MKLKNIILISLTLMSIIYNSSKAATLLVGTGGGDCGFPNILTALNFASSGDTIAVAVGTYSGIEAQLTIDRNLILKGGLSENCQIFTNELTVLQSDLPGAVINVDVSGGNEVTISGFDISGSQLDILSSYTSGIHVTGAGTLKLENTLIHDNQSSLGGGISAINNAIIDISANTEIYSNTSLSAGGGIYCFDCSIFAVDTLIGKKQNGIEMGNSTSNSNASGGGIYAENANIALGVTNITSGTVNVNYNKSNNGSGIALKNSNLSFGFKGSQISYNSSQILEGLAVGTAILGLGDSQVNLTDIKVTDNEFGVALNMKDSSDLMVKSSCSKPPCSEISRNKGTAVRIESDATAFVSQTLIDGNSQTAVLEALSDTHSLITIENSVISNHNNIPDSAELFFTSGFGEIQMWHVTVSNNQDPNNAFNIFRSVNNNSPITFDSGIIYGNSSPDLYANGDPFVQIRSSIIQYPITGGMVNVLQADPLLIDDYHISFNSPAIDLVTEIILPIDIENDLRPQGIAFDAGADEWTDLIFKNGFEQN